MGEQQQSHNNPWAACFVLGENIFETRFLLYSLGYILLSLLGKRCYRSYHAAVTANPTSPPDARSVKSLIASRPTVIAAQVHSVATSIVSVGILAAYYTNTQQEEDGDGDRPSPWTYRTISLVRVWQRIGLPLSLSYFVTDCYFYCLPRGDVLIFVHHLIMVLCHYPVACDGGAVLAGAGDVEWVTWLSIVGYTSEVSTALMNYRWYLINTLEENWVGFGIVNCLVVAGWAGRVVTFAYLLVAEIFPRRHLYVAQRQLFTYGVMVFGHAGIGLLSLYWCFVMCRGGLKSLFVFEKKRPKALNPEQGFSFAAEVGGTNNSDGADSRKKSQ